MHGTGLNISTWDFLFFNTGGQEESLNVHCGVPPATRILACIVDGVFNVENLGQSVFDAGKDHVNTRYRNFQYIGSFGPDMLSDDSRHFGSADT